MMSQMMVQNQKNLENILNGNSERNISAVIATYKRYPHKRQPHLNPISWAAESLGNQPNIAEIIFVDDCSHDYFDSTIDYIESKISKEIKVTAIKNNERLGLGETRNVGINNAHHPHIFFMDDDCIVVSSYVLPHMQYAFEYLKSRGIPVGSLIPPVNGNSLETILTDDSEIAKVSAENGAREGTSTKFPLHYLKNPNKYLLNHERRIWQPLEVDFFYGVFLTDKKSITETGGFPTTSWRSAAGQDIEPAFVMKKSGKRIFYLPSYDINFRVLHMRYGDPEIDSVPYTFKVCGLSFDEILRVSKSKAVGHGCRVPESERLKTVILSDARLIFKFYGKRLGYENLEGLYNKISDDMGEKESFYSAVQDLIPFLLDEEIFSKYDARYIRQRYLSEART